MTDCSSGVPWINGITEKGVQSVGPQSFEAFHVSVSVPMEAGHNPESSNPCKSASAPLARNANTARLLDAACWMQRLHVLANSCHGTYLRCTPLLPQWFGHLRRRSLNPK